MRVLIAMSGGVDSTVAALMMKQRGYECGGAMMFLHGSAVPADAADAAAVAEKLGIPFELLDYREAFRKEIIGRFIRTYESGGTPNPCVDCNRIMKFGKFLEAAKERGYDAVATGHYARIIRDPDSGRFLLKKAVNTAKDQSYVLYGLRQEQLSRAFFPLGEAADKESVRETAQAEGLVNAHKHDSQDICFVPDGDYAGYLARETGREYKPGNFVSPEGEILGRHKGIIHYTIGQRKGLGIAAESPYFVTEIDPEENTVTLTHGEGLFSRTVFVKDINLISVPEVRREMRVKAKIRYRHAEQPAVLTQPEPGVLRLDFDEPQRAVTRGQSAVIYDGDTVVGGGIITGRA